MTIALIVFPHCQKLVARFGCHDVIANHIQPLIIVTIPAAGMVHRSGGVD
ncbi:MAG: hypothetical protein QG615_622, partial [Nitrospirota bacterium]|nr:hypothetical protein [Nitrospirota bacterium]